jgi:hypothetical protein
MALILPPLLRNSVKLLLVVLLLQLDQLYLVLVGECFLLRFILQVILHLRLHK